MTVSGTAMLPNLDLHAGEWVEVRSAEEILATLDEAGKLEGMPFMPEMLRYCGQRFKVMARAHKACDTINKTGCRSIPSTVHLDLRCDGSAHGGCQAACLLFWKEAWLKRVGQPAAPVPAPQKPPLTLVQLNAATRKPGTTEAYACQATELFDASAPLSPSDPRQYIDDIRYGNVGLLRFLKYMSLAIFNVLQKWRGGRTFPVVGGQLKGKTPSGRLDLKVGEMVRVKSREEIVATLDVRDRNRGLYFDREFVPFCGKTFRVAARVERIVNEKTGEIMVFNNDCIALEGVACLGHHSDRRMFCPRAIIPYWRELWLERVEQ